MQSSRVLPFPPVFPPVSARLTVPPAQLTMVSDGAADKSKDAEIWRLMGVVSKQTLEIDRLEAKVKALEAEIASLASAMHQPCWWCHNVPECITVREYCCRPALAWCLVCPMCWVTVCGLCCDCDYCLGEMKDMYEELTL